MHQGIGIVLDRDTRSILNRAAHAIGQAAESDARKGLYAALEAMREADVPLAAGRAYLASCEAAGTVLPIPAKGV
jgi:hypothetical protein